MPFHNPTIARLTAPLLARVKRYDRTSVAAVLTFLVLGTAFFTWVRAYHPITLVAGLAVAAGGTAFLVREQWPRLATTRFKARSRRREPLDPYYAWRVQLPESRPPHRRRRHTDHHPPR